MLVCRKSLQICRNKTWTLLGNLMQNSKPALDIRKKQEHCAHQYEISDIRNSCWPPVVIIRELKETRRFSIGSDLLLYYAAFLLIFVLFVLSTCLVLQPYKTKMKESQHDKSSDRNFFFALLFLPNWRYEQRFSINTGSSVSPVSYRIEGKRCRVFRLPVWLQNNSKLTVLAALQNVKKENTFVRSLVLNFA
jgi:hypothetical protein